MRFTASPLLSSLLLGTLFLAPGALAQLIPEEITVETMSSPGENWFISKTDGPGYIFDANTGEMQGLLSLSDYTPAVTIWAPREEFYAAESYLSRGVYGDRTDIIAIYDYENLSPVAEIEIPNHMARLSVRNHLGLTGNGRHLAVLNMNPGHSVSIVDVADRVFVYEISTPGCAVIMPVAENDFLQVCGDGTLQLIQLDISGFETNRVRSPQFFDVIEDAVFDRTARSADGWYLITHGGTIYEVSTDDNQISISDGWDIVSEEDQGWRPGGDEFFGAHQDSGLIYVAMHQGDIDTHHVAGTQVWVLSSNTGRLLQKMEMDSPVTSLMVTQEANPKLIVATEEGDTEVFDAISFQHERSIQTPGASMFEDF
jgi:methylamine dehydrogenase heavy chain